MKRLIVGVLVAVSMPLCAFAKPKKQPYNNSAQQVFDAALRTARDHQVVTFVDEKNLLFTFETGTSTLSYGFVANASVEPDGTDKSTLIISVQKKNAGKDASVSWGAGDRMADKFFKDVTDELTNNPQPQAAETAKTPPASNAVSPDSAVSVGTVDVASTPNGADIDVDGAFVGNTPSSLKLPAGKHTVAVSETGFKAWTKDLMVLGGSDAQLRRWPNQAKDLSSDFSRKPPRMTLGGLARITTGGRRVPVTSLRLRVDASTSGSLLCRSCSSESLGLGNTRHNHTPNTSPFVLPERPA